MWPSGRRIRPRSPATAPRCGGAGSSGQDRPERLWTDLDLADPSELTVVVEPTRNAWIVIAEWFRRRGARVVMVPTTQSADLRKYYSKHTKNDRIDSELLARLPLLVHRRGPGPQGRPPDRSQVPTPHGR